jgi:succinate dehydrogenase / fumarate reductase, cytochrome b subunit
MTAGERSSTRRLHSITGLVPIGGFLAFHLYENSLAARGPVAYNEAARRLQQMPFALALEILLIGVPILYHGVYGLFLAVGGGRSASRESGLRPVLYALQRITGVVVFAFIVFHLWTTRLVQLADHGELDLYFLVRSTIANPWLYAFYLIGILSATSHLSIGLWTFGVAWDLVPGPRARRLVAFLSAAVFLVLSVTGVRAITAFRMAAGP